MRLTLSTLVAGTALLLVAAIPVSAHNLVVFDPHTGEVVHQQWIGGSSVPADADVMFGPFNLPPSHGKGLVHACQGTDGNEAVSILAPPYFTGCQHGSP